MRESVRAVARRVTEGRGFELVDVEVKGGGERRLVRIYVDKEGGIGLAELQSVSEEMSAILDVEDPIKSSYTLEVSSPGLDRPLRSESDFRRAVGRLVNVESREPIDGRRRFSGRLTAVQDGAAELTLEKERSAVVHVPLGGVVHARLEPEFRRQER
ncbi:MAG TPA: ribosome maturation factor RimP [Vicinamibacteria bacterium]